MAMGMAMAMVAIPSCSATTTATTSRPPAVVVTDRDRPRSAPVAVLPLPAGGRFALSYVHSLYGVPTTELFAAQADGEAQELLLVAIVTGNEAVLDYYGLPGQRERQPDGGWWLNVVPPVAYGRLAVAGTDQGRRTLQVGAACLPLFEPGTAARHLVLTIARRPPTVPAAVTACMAETE